jgi:hypothetical protein
MLDKPRKHRCMEGVREGVGKGGEMTQTLYAHMNKIKILKINK